MKLADRIRGDSTSKLDCHFLIVLNNINESIDIKLSADISTKFENVLALNKSHHSYITLIKVWIIYFKNIK